MDLATGNGVVVIDSETATPPLARPSAEDFARLEQKIDTVTWCFAEMLEKQRRAAAAQLSQMLANPQIQQAMIADILKAM